MFWRECVGDVAAPKEGMCCLWGALLSPAHTNPAPAPLSGRDAEFQRARMCQKHLSGPFSPGCLLRLVLGFGRARQARQKGVKLLAFVGLGLSIKTHPTSFVSCWICPYCNNPSPNIHKIKSQFLLGNFGTLGQLSAVLPYLSGVLRSFANKQAYKVRFIAFDFLLGNWSPFNLGHALRTLCQRGWPEGCVCIYVRVWFTFAVPVSSSSW